MLDRCKHDWLVVYSRNPGFRGESSGPKWLMAGGLANSLGMMRKRDEHGANNLSCVAIIEQRRF